MSNGLINQQCRFRDNLLVTTAARAAYMDARNDIDIPGGIKGEEILSEFVAKIVDYYIDELVDINFDEYIELELLTEFERRDE